MALTDDILTGLIETAVAAGREVLAVYAVEFDVTVKGDDSPVTEADRRAEAVILDHLARLLPGVPVVAEEAAAEGHLPEVLGDRFILVDPLDGTREFIARNGEFTVNIAIIDHGRPTAGVVYAPALGEIYAGVVGAGAGVGRVVGDQVADWREARVRAVPEGYQPPRAGDAAYARSVVAYAHRLAYTTAAPPGFVLGTTPLRHFKPPAPQEAQLRASLLHQFAREAAGGGGGRGRGGALARASDGGTHTHLCLCAYAVLAAPPTPHSRCRRL